MASSTPLLKKFTNYTNDASGLENLLRLLQYSCQVVEISSINRVAAEPWAIAWKNLALGRRYFRYFKFIDCFERSWALFPARNDPASIERQGGYITLTLGMCMWSTFGCYLFLEAFTILDALGIWVTTWSRETLLESYKFWFYSIVFSILGSCWQHMLIPDPGQKKENPTAPSSQEKDGGEKSSSEGETKDVTSSTDRTEAANRESEYSYDVIANIIVGLCDILIPATLLDWFEIHPLIVSSAGVLSSLLVGHRRWAAAQQKGNGD